MAEPNVTIEREAGVLRVRRATPADAPMLAQLGARTFRESFGSENTPENMAAYLAKAFDVAVIARELADTDVTYLVADTTDRPVGYAMVRVVVAPPEVAGPAPLELVRFYVDRPWHGSGVARTLMSACDDEARRRRAGTLWLGVWERNPRAIRFYEKCGFRDVGSHTFILGDDEQTDRLMSRPIPAS
jgi:ribosomal protein S18 acetylase RimI-like enzyme